MSSSSSSSGNIFLENIAQFRDYSLDPALIEKYFNKGPYAIEVDLDIFQNSSSSEFKIKFNPIINIFYPY